MAAAGSLPPKPPEYANACHSTGKQKPLTEKSKSKLHRSNKKVDESTEKSEIVQTADKTK